MDKLPLQWTPTTPPEAYPCSALEDSMPSETYFSLVGSQAVVQQIRDT
jgi:hypothetical protein